MPKITSELWRERIRQLTLNNDEKGIRFGPQAVLSSLNAVYEDMSERDRIENGRPPSLASIGRIQSDARKMTPEERQRYLWFYWPLSMQEGQLPWEASSAALELLVRRDGSWPQSIEWGRAIGEDTPRPSIRMAEAFWHVTQAVSDAPASFRFRLTVATVIAERKSLGLTLPSNIEAEIAKAVHLKTTPAEEHNVRWETLEMVARDWLGFADL